MVVSQDSEGPTQSTRVVDTGSYKVIKVKISTPYDISYAHTLALEEAKYLYSYGGILNYKGMEYYETLKEEDHVLMAVFEFFRDKDRNAN